MLTGNPALRPGDPPLPVSPLLPLVISSLFLVTSPGYGS